MSTRSGKILKPDVGKHGYCRVRLSLGDNTKRFLVHRLVAHHFIENSNDKPFVNHLDNNPQNNKVSNLEWCTASENMRHSRNQGRQDKVTKLAAPAMAEANRKKAKLKYDTYIDTNINGRILLSYFKEGKRYKGNFMCSSCSKDFTAELDAVLRNRNREMPLYCRACMIRMKR